MLKNNKRTQKFYRENEKEVMKRLGLKPTKNSGAGWIEKEDGQNDHLICQLKSTDVQSMRIQLSDFHSLERNALVSHKIPVFVIQFLTTNEIYIMAKPLDFPNVAKYLECGECKIPANDIVVETEEKEVKERPLIKSGNRQDFWVEREKEWENGKYKNKSNRKI